MVKTCIIVLGEYSGDVLHISGQAERLVRRSSDLAGVTEVSNKTTQRPRHLLIILNRRASERRMDRFQAVLSRLRQAGCSYEIKEIRAAGDAARFAARADAADVDLVVVAGGDGTINDAINGFHPGTPPLGLIPLGTANVLAYEIGLGTDPQHIADTLLAGRRLSVVPGQVNDRRFLMMASVGFDAHVVGGVRREMKRRIGKLVYAVEAVRQLWRYPCPPLNVSIDGDAVEAATLVISRGRLYGGRYVMAPQADLQKPEFHVSIFRRPGRWAMAGYSAALPLGLLNRCKLIGHKKGQTIEVSGRPGDPVQADGDVVTTQPVVVSLADHPIHIAAPPQ